MTTGNLSSIFTLRFLVSLSFAAIAGLGLAACGSDDTADDDASSAEENAEQDSTETPVSDGDSNSVAASGGTTTTVPPIPESSVPALVDATSDNVTVGGFIFEVDGGYLLCEAATDTDPPECEGETIEIANGEVIDPAIFLGEPGSQYSDAEVVVTGDVADGVLTIG